MSDSIVRTCRVHLGGGWALALELDTLTLRVVGGPDEGLQKSFQLPTVRVGTAPDCDLVLTDSSVSRLHARLDFGPGGIRLVDLDSTNGVFVGDVKVREAELRPDQEFRLGQSRLQALSGTVRKDAVFGDEAQCGELVGESPVMRELYALIRTVAPTPISVLVLGETGTGKELVAAAIHAHSGRKGPFVVFDGSATSPELVLADLFGHVKGAFTGAAEERPGAFRAAEGGTLFIDEVGELPPDAQAGLLRALEAREVSPLGSDRRIPVDVRVVAATHRDLEQMVEERAFRADLYHRLAVMFVDVPSLHERPEDLELLCGALLARMDRELEIPEEALEVLRGHHWPGNVRELRNVLERLGTLHAGSTIDAGDVARALGPRRRRDPRPAPGAVGPMREQEKRIILETLARNGENKAATARELGISTVTLWRRLKRYSREDG